MMTFISIQPELEAAFDTIADDILSRIQPGVDKHLSKAQCAARIAELDRQAEMLQQKLSELDHATKEYLDKEDIINPINEKQFKVVIKLADKDKERKRREAGRKRYPKRNIKRLNYFDLEVS